jgi:hypothetical protein
VITQRAGAVALLALGLAGCPRTKTSTPDASAGPSAPDASAHAESPPSTPVSAPDAGAAEGAPWITLNDSNQGEAPPRIGGIVLHPEIELPSRTIPDGTTDPWTPRAGIEANFPYVALRTRGLPALSADGSRVAHVFGPLGCCRGTGYATFTLYVFDARTGATKNKVLLWTVDDELRVPQRDETNAQGTRFAPGVRLEATEEALEHNLAAYERLLGQRAAAARALLEGEWSTLGSLVIDEDADELRRLRGEDLEIRSGAKEGFPPVSILRGGTTKTFPGSRFRVPPRSCPLESLALRLDAGYALRDKPFAIIETSQGYAAPDGCEGANMQFLSWTAPR